MPSPYSPRHGRAFARSAEMLGAGGLDAEVRDQRTSWLGLTGAFAVRHTGPAHLPSARFRPHLNSVSLFPCLVASL